jgi:hypothetical protein
MVSNLPKCKSQKDHAIKRGRRQAQRGQGFIEVIIGLGILLILLHAFASLIITAYDLLGNARTRITARYIAVSRMEEIRNLPYDSIGVSGGIPAGDIPQLETINRNGQDYSLRTSVIYIDDPFDGLAPSDSTPGDYKRARVEVSWTGRFVAGETVTMITDTAADATAGGGLLSILAFNANADPVPQADVHILNTTVTPQIDLSLKTNDQGRVFLPGAPTCNTCYEITVTKDNYSTDKTYSTSQVANPNKPHATVVEGFITEVSFSIDATTTLHFASTMDRDNNFSPLGSKAFHLQGGKIIGTDGLGDSVYKYDEDLQTDGSASLTLENMEWDSYQLTLPTGSWDLAGTNPLRPIIVFPAAELDVLFASSSHQTDTLLVAVTDASGSAIASASAQLTGPDSYDETLFTGENTVPDFGQAFFTPLTAADYSLKVTKIGYVPAINSVGVSGQTEYSVQLNSL